MILWIFLLSVSVSVSLSREICLFLASTDPQAMSGRGGGGRRSGSRPDHSSPAHIPQSSILNRKHIIKLKLVTDVRDAITFLLIRLRKIGYKM